MRTIKTLLLLAILAAGAFGQVVFVPDKPAAPAMPGNLAMTDATSGAPTLSCVITANAIPATAITISCVDGASTVASYSVTFVTGMSYLVSVAHGTNSVLALLTYSSAGIAVSAISHGGTPIAQGTW